MGQITFIEHSNDEHVVDIEDGKSLMQLAVDNLVPGIDADCGGGCACGTCHVMLDSPWIDHVGELSIEESHMLEMTPDKKETSRLSCQVTVTEAMDGMKVYLPEFQM